MYDFTPLQLFYSAFRCSVTWTPAGVGVGRVGVGVVTLKDIPLGGLLSDIRYPNQDVLNVANVAEGSQHVAVRTENNIQHDLQTSERSWFDAQISRLVATSYQ
jgi:hypothetical protein